MAGIDTRGRSQGRSVATDQSARHAAAPPRELPSNPSSDADFHRELADNPLQDRNGAAVDVDAPKSDPFAGLLSLGYQILERRSVAFQRGEDARYPHEPYFTVQP